MQDRTGLNQVAFIGNHLPRRCGLATFTTDVCRAVAAEFPQTDCFAVAVNDTSTGYNYPDQVRFELHEQDLSSYYRAADFLNNHHIDLVCLQHEYGIYGGPAGSHILSLLRELHMPIVTTLHTILREPDRDQRRVMNELARLSDRLIVMSERSVDFLREIYKIPTEKIDFIHHGIPDISFIDPNFYKDQFGVEGKLVLLTFGLLSPNKGIENVIEALPTVLERHPNVVYIVLGATHPHIVRNEGEVYRDSLKQLARDKGVESNVIFEDRFVSLEELVEFIGAADIYLTPYLNEAQIASGTLAYTLGAGKAVISTPYWYAEELLADGRGRLVPFHNPGAIAEQVNHLLDNEAERHAMRKRGYLYGREMIWSNVARLYEKSFERARQDRRSTPRPILRTPTLEHEMGELPHLKLNHLRRMTDDTGMLQHATFTVPNYDEGYTTDDNARALVLALLLEEQAGTMPENVEPLAMRYLAFLWHAFNEETDRFRNFQAYDRRWLEEIGSEDSHGRALWALGATLGRSRDDGLCSLANRLFERALPVTQTFTSPRAWAFTLIGIHEYLRRYAGDREAQRIRVTLAERLFDLYKRNRSDDWPWFEDIFTYANAKLPHALLLCGQWLDRPDMAQAGLESLEWLANIQRADGGHFAPVGNRGFYRRGGEKARFDQQPLEAHAMVSACLEAYRMTGSYRWYQEAYRIFEWFMGRNDLGLPLYDVSTGGCRDGLTPDWVNANEGAESTLAFLLSLAELSLSTPVTEPLSELLRAEPSLRGLA